MRNLLAVAAVCVAVGCGSGNPSTRTAAVKHPDDEIRASADSEPAADDVNGTSFGIANSFSGRLADEQERLVPEPLRGQFQIESLREITASELAKELRFKTLVAEEFRNGTRYVALQDARHVQFSEDLGGMMLVIERYVILPDVAANECE